MTSTNLRHYFETVQHSFKAGTATEHTYRPALKALLESLDLSVTATNEPKRIACGAPDYVVTRGDLVVGYIEAKDVGKSLTDAERSEQLKRYLRSLDNLILTDYLEFRRYTGGELRQKATLAHLQPDGKLKAAKDGPETVEALLRAFLAHRPQPVNTPRDLAVRLARLAHMIRDIIVAAFENEQASPLLRSWREAFARALIADLDQPEKTADFADMFAQTLAYGLFTARVMDTSPGFTRQEAQHLIPKSNAFLRKFFYQITGPDMDEEPFANFVDDLVNVLAQTDMEAVLADFGRRTRQEDPVVHFYETFLAAYDPALREGRGVYYTPEPVVSYIVRSVDYLLKTRFNCPQGLADSAKISVPNYDPSLTVKGKKEMRKTIESHKVLILDPATGTATFLYAVIDYIRSLFMQQGNAGMWPGYVKEHLLPRLFGFELLMAPYAVAHFKLSLQLAGRDLPEAQRAAWAYQFDSDERLGVYLTNTLEEAHEMTGLPLFTQWVADETNAANEVKRHLPIMVVMGNPPYSGHSANKGNWVRNLVRDYYFVDGKMLDERNSKWLLDDYVKFIRWSQWRIERTGGGILAFISNNGYLDNPTFRGMRQQLIQSFTEIYILNLHGNSKKKEIAPDGSIDENVFDIQQGVTIGIFIKQEEKKGRTQVLYADLWGKREHKYQSLFDSTIESTEWKLLEPQTPFYLFVPQSTDLLGEYEKGWKITDAMPVNGWGIATRKDYLLVDFSHNDLIHRFQDIRSLSLNEAIDKYGVKQSPHWNFAKAKEQIPANIQGSVKNVLFRPFDVRYIFYEKFMIERGDHRYDLMSHMFQKNLSLITVRRSEISGIPKHFYCSKHISVLHSTSSKEGNFVFPLYLYITPEDTAGTLFATQEITREANFSHQFIAAVEAQLGLLYIPDGIGDLETTFGPEDIFHYIYAIFHAPTYRSRYAEFLKIDFPRVPLTADVALFRTLCGFGRELAGLHLLESPAVNALITRYPATGDNRVEKGYPKYLPPGEPEPGTGQPLAEGRVYVNQNQYFEGVPPEVWEFHIGGYQVCDKWLKDRRDRQLSYADLTHYQQMMVALKETLRLMREIDAAITEWPIQ